MTRLAPLWQQGNNYPAAVDRGLISALFPSGGSSGHACAISSGTMNVTVALGLTAVPLTGTNGVELCRSDATETVTLQTAPAGGQNRYDLICVQVRDAAVDAGSNNDWIVSVVTGTAAASPAIPAVPNNAFCIAQVYVPGGVINLNTATLTDRRWQLGLPGQRVASVVRPSNFGFTGTGDTDAGMPLTLYVPAGRKLRLEVTWGSGNSSVATGQFFVKIKEGATKLQEYRNPFGNVAFFAPGGCCACNVSPSAGAHTYSVTGNGDGSNNYNVNSTVDQPFSFDIFDLGI